MLQTYTRPLPRLFLPDVNKEGCVCACPYQISIILFNTLVNEVVLPPPSLYN